MIIHREILEKIICFYRGFTGVSAISFWKEKLQEQPVTPMVADKC